ncbi:hypothetical protein LCGC14_1929400, partial [marine sediment metagenome]
VQMLTKEIGAKLPKLYETDNIPPAEKVCVVKFFQPWGSWTWYAVEFDGQDRFFGLVDGFELEWGYFSLQELRTVQGPGRMAIERDLYFGMPQMKDIRALQGRESSWC